MLIEMPPTTTPHRLSKVRMHRVGRAARVASPPDSKGCPGMFVFDADYKSTEADAASYGTKAAEGDIADKSGFNDEPCFNGYGLNLDGYSGHDELLLYAYQDAYLAVFVRDAYFQIPLTKRPPPTPALPEPPSVEPPPPPSEEPLVDPAVDAGAWSAELTTDGLADSGWSESSLGSTEAAADPAAVADPAAAITSTDTTTSTDTAATTKTKTKTSRFAPATIPTVATPAPRVTPTPTTTSASGRAGDIGGAALVGGAAIVALLAYHWFSD